MPSKDKFNTSLNKNRKSKIGNKSGSWLSNAAKSLGYSSVDVLSEIMPNTINMSKTAIESSQEFINEMKDIKTVKGRLTQTMENNVYMDLWNQWKGNALDDIKTGKFYNKERQDKAFEDDFDFDMDGFDVGDDSDFDTSVKSTDGSTSISMKRNSGDKQEVDMITVNTNINDDNPMVGAVQNQTRLAVQSNSASMELSKRNQLLTMQALQQMGTSLGGVLTSINSNVISISKDTTEMLSRHLGISAKYYDDSIKLFTDIHKELQEMNTKTRVSGDASNPNANIKEYNDVMDIFSGGSINIKEYMGLVKKQFDSASDSNLFLSAFKNMASQTDVLEMMAQNPLKFMADGVIKKMIPSIVKKTTEDFDQTLGEAIVSKLYQVSNLQNSSNPILEMVGKVFGINNKRVSFDKSQYEKGKVEWNGISHRTLNDVIPFYLRKIYATLSGTQEIGFDYEKGTYSYVNDMVKQQKDDLEARMLSPLSGMISDFKEFLGQVSFAETGQRTQMEDQFRKLALSLVKSEGGKNFRKITDKNGNVRDDLASLLGVNTGDPMVELMRGFFQGSKNADVMRFFNSDVLNAKAGYSKLINDMMRDPIRYNSTMMDLGTPAEQDQFLQYDKSGTKVKYKKAGGSGLGSDNFKKTPNDYLRGILDTLNRGIKVAVVNDIDFTPVSSGKKKSRRHQTANFRLARGAEYDDIVAQSKSKMDKLKEDSDKFAQIDKLEQKQAQGKTLTQEEIRILSNKGRYVVDTSSGAMDTNVIKSLRQEQIEAQYNQGNETALSRAGILAPQSALNKLVYKFSRYMDKPGEVISDFFGKADNFVFKLVFGEENADGSEKSLLGSAFKHMQTTFTKFTQWLDEKVITPLHETLFGDNGIFTNLKNSQMVQDMKDYMANMVDSLLGQKNAANNNLREGGLLSGINNQFKSTFSLVKQALIGGKAYDAYGNQIEATSPSVLDHVKSAGHKVGTYLGDMFGIESDPTKPSSGNAIVDGMDNIWSTIKKRTSAFMDDVFGPESDDPTSKRNRANQFMAETKEALPKSIAYGTIGAGASLGMGLMGTWFLPGGPIGGALLGAGIGLVSSSESLKRTLFGELVDDGKGGQTRINGLINKETQDFFKKHGKGMMFGAGTGMFAASQLGLVGGLFTPLGPVGGALIGAGISMATQTEEFKQFLFGETDDQGNVIKKGILGSLKDNLGGDSRSFSDKFLDTGIGAGVGLIGSFFLPGGPIMGSLLGAVGGLALNSDKIKTMLFGEKGEDGAREGGLFGSMKGWMVDNIGDPLKRTIEKTSMKVTHFMETNMVNPFMRALDPVKEEFSRIQQRISTGFHNVMTSFKENANKSFERFFGKPLGDFMAENVITPLKNVLGRIFGGIGKVLGTVAASPFKLLNTVADGLFAKHQKEGKDAFIEDGIENLVGRASRQKRKEEGIKRKLFSTYDKDGNKVGKGFFGDLREFASIKNYRESANGEKGANYNKDRKWEQANTLRQLETDNKYIRSQIEYDEKWNGGKNSKTLMKQLTKNEKKLSRMNPVQSNEGTKVSTPVSSSSNDSSNETITNPGVSDSIQSTNENKTRVSSTRPSKKISTASKLSKASTKISSGNLETPQTEEEKTQVSNNEDRANTVASMESKIAKGKVSSARLSQAQRDSLLKNIEGHTKVIATEVRGQLDGVGSNIFKLRKIVQSKLGVSDDDISGAANRDRLGFFGKLKRGLRNPLEFVGNLLMTPIQGVVSGVTKVVNTGLEAVSMAFKLPLKAIEYTGKGIAAIGKGIWLVTTSLLEIPKLLAGSLLEVLKTIGPIVTTAAVQGLKFVGTALTEGVKVVGKTLTSAISTIGGALVGAARGIGSTIGTIMSTTAKVIGGGIVLAKDMIVEAGSLLVKGVGAVTQTLFNVASAPFKFIGKALGWTANKVTSKTIQKVQVVGGKLDVVREVKSISNEKPQTKLSTTKELEDSDGKVGQETVSTGTDNVYTGISLHTQEQEEKKDKEESRAKVTGKNYDYYVEKDRLEDEEVKKQKEKASLFGKLSELTSVTKEQSVNWLKAFGKKGLITGALLLGIPLIWNAIKDFKKLFEGNDYNEEPGSNIIERYDNSGRHDPDEEGGYIENNFYKKAKTKAIIDGPRTLYKMGKKILPESFQKIIAKGTSTGIGVVKSGGADLTKIAVNSYESSKYAKPIVDKFITSFKKGVDIFLDNPVVKNIIGPGIDLIKTKVNNGIASMSEFCIKNFPSLSKKFARMGSDATWVFPPLGLTIDLVFGISDAITGYNEAAKIFRVSVNDVTFGMRVIGALTKVLVGWNGVIDFGNEVIRIMTDGIGFRELLADWLYEVACSVGSSFGFDETEDLKSKQSKHKQEYETYNNQIQSDGKDAISFSAYQDKMHEDKSIIKQASKWISSTSDKVGNWTSEKWTQFKGWGSEKLDKYGQWSSDNREKFKTWGSTALSKTKDFGSNLWDGTKETLHNLSGNIFNDKGVRDTLGLADGVDVSFKHRMAATWGNITGLFFKDAETNASAIYEIMSGIQDKVTQSWNDTKAGVTAFWEDTKRQWSDSMTSLNKQIGTWFGFVDDNGESISFTEGTKALATEKMQVIKDYIKTTREEASKWWSDTKTMVSANWENTKKEWNDGVDKFNKSLGALFGFQDDNGDPVSFTAKMSDVKNKTLAGISSSVSFVQKEAADMWSRFSNAFKDAKAKVIEKIKELPSTIDKALGSLFGLSDEEGNKKGLFEWAGEKVSNIGTNVSNWWQDLSNRGTTRITQDNMESGGMGGFGGDDFTYYSQNDPRYANNAYNTSSGYSNGGVPETIGKRGCGPTSLAMVTSELTGRQVDPNTMAGMATQQGYSTNMGTDPSYFKNVGSQFGLNVNESSASEGSLKSSLSSGQPVILQGMSQGGPDSAFTPYGHYVVATKTKGDKVMVNDPRGRQYSKAYNINQLIGESAKMWSFGKGGFGDGPNVGQAIVDISSQFQGRPYVWGSEGPTDWNGDGETSEGFDCSGLVGHALHHAGVTGYGRLTAAGFYNNTIRINKSDLVIGDLGFIKDKNGAITHVGIYAGNDEWVEAMGDPTGKVVRVPSKRASKWNAYGRLKEVAQTANISADYQTYVNDYRSSDDSTNNTQPQSLMGGVLDIVKNKLNNFLGLTIPGSEGQGIVPMYGDTLSATQASSLRDAVNKKTRELLVQSESGGNYAIAKNDMSSETGNKISPSIGVLQWRGTYADELMKRMRQALPNDPEAKYFDSINWTNEANRGPWTESQLARYRNFMSKNEAVSQQVQNTYAESYINDRLTNNLFKHMVDPGLIRDPRSMVLLNDISQTGPAHVSSFAEKYNPSIPSGSNEFNHFYNELTGNKSYWGRKIKIYGNRFSKNKAALQNWEVQLPGYQNPIKQENRTDTKTKVIGNDERNDPLSGEMVMQGMGGFGDIKPNSKKYSKAKPVNKDYATQSRAVKIKEAIQGFGGQVSSQDGRVVELLSTMVDYLKGTKEGIDKFNTKDFSASSNNTIQYVDGSSTNNINNGKPILDRRSTASPKRVETKTSDRAYSLAKGIAGGLLV